MTLCFLFTLTMFQTVDQTFLKFRHPFTAICVGATMSGKTHYLAKLIANKDEMICPPVQRVIYSYKKYQPIFDTMKDVQFVQGMNFTLDKSIPTLLIVDDQMNDQLNQQLTELFTVNCHHDNTSVIFVSQNLFFQNKAYRTACLNAMYIILFRSPRGSNQVNHLARQIYTGEKAKAMVQAYEHATQKPFSNFIVDLKPDTPTLLRLRSNVLPEEGLPFGGVHLSHCYNV